MKNNKAKKTVYTVLICCIALLTAVLIFIFTDKKSEAPEKTSAVTEETAPSEATPIPENTVTVGTAGDILIHKPVYENAKTADGNYDFNHIFTFAESTISECDYFIVNLETTFGGTDNQSYSGFPRFNSPDAVADALKNAGVDCVLTANNHSYDTDGNGVSRTIETAEKAGLDYTGSRKNTAEKQYLIKNIDGINFGFICYTYETPVAEGYKALNGIILDSDTSPLINSFKPDAPDEFLAELETNIEKMKAENADVIAVFMHWGEEYQLTENNNQKAVAQAICDLGADVIIGGHPHVVQPVDLLTSSDNTHKTVCVYSMGNFVSNQRRSLMGLKTGHTEDGIIFEMTFTKYSDGEVKFDCIEIIPTWVHLYYENGKQIHAIVPLDGDIEKDAEAKGLTKSSDGTSLAIQSKERTVKLTDEGEKKCNDYLLSENAPNVG